MELDTCSLHFGPNCVDLGIYAPGRLPMRGSQLVVERGNLSVQALAHFIELGAGPFPGEAITKGKGSALVRRHRCLRGVYFNCPSNLTAPESPRASSASLPPTA